jgi:hypothetical protein
MSAKQKGLGEGFGEVLKGGVETRVYGWVLVEGLLTGGSNWRNNLVKALLDGFHMKYGTKASKTCSIILY